MWEMPPGAPLQRMFAGLTEHAFLTRFGIADPPLVDYLSGLLSRFVHADTVYRLRDADGRPLDAEHPPIVGGPRDTDHLHERIERELLGRA